MLQSRFFTNRSDEKKFEEMKKNGTLRDEVKKFSEKDDHLTLTKAEWDAMQKNKNTLKAHIAKVSAEPQKDSGSDILDEIMALKEQLKASDEQIKKDEALKKNAPAAAAPAAAPAK